MREEWENDGYDERFRFEERELENIFLTYKMTQRTLKVELTVTNDTFK